MVAEEDHGRVVREPGARQGPSSRPRLSVAERDRAVIGVPGIADLLVGERLRVHGADMADALRVRVERHVALADARQVDGGVIVEVPIARG